MKKEYKSGVNFIFKENPELERIGSESQYEAYLKTIFPGRKVKNIVYHQTRKKFDEFHADKSKTGGIYFSPFNNSGRILHTKAAIVDIKDPLVISKKQNKKLERYLPNMKKLGKKVNLQEYDGVVGFSNVFYDRGQLDSEFFDITPSLKNNVEFVVFDTEKIHILGSKKDVKSFKEFIHGENQENPGDSLEKRIITGVFSSFILVGLFFSIPSINGNVIENNGILSNLGGGLLFAIGIMGLFIRKKLK